MKAIPRPAPTRCAHDKNSSRFWYNPQMEVFPRSLWMVSVAMVGLMLMALTSAEIGFAAETQAKASESFAVRYRGCQSGGWCRFEIETAASGTQSLYRVYPDGIARDAENQAVAIAIRNRLNALLANMIHQYKHVELRELRSVGEGYFAAIVIVDGNDVASDPILLELQGKPASNPR
ncbi:MAG: hypothetical protein JSU95_04225 [Betaproteobacteria bacterium]|nr:MAG: hypothetical protein JSU95_04225 [Betaproteobacteria bacterium]